MQVLPLSGFQRNALHETNKQAAKKRTHEFKLFGLKAYLLHLQTLKSGNPPLVFFHQGWSSFLPFCQQVLFCSWFTRTSPSLKFWLPFSSEKTMASSNTTQIQSDLFRWVAEPKHNPKSPFLPQKEMRRGEKSPRDFSMPTCSTYDFLNKWVKAGIRLLTL